MKIQRSAFSLAAFAALVACALTLGGVAQARDLAWSVGIASPGVQFGVSNAPRFIYRQPVYGPQPVVVQPQTVYYGQPQVLYSQPQVVYPQPQVMYPQPQVVYAPQPYYVGSGWAPPVYYRGWGPHHHWHHGWDHERHR